MVLNEQHMQGNVNDSVAVKLLAYENNKLHCAEGRQFSELCNVKIQGADR